MNSAELIAPAKINLMLDVTGRRQDGFHTLNTIMQSISLADRLFIESNGSGDISLGCRADGISDEIPNGKKNIAYKAARAFLDYSGADCGGLYIGLEKRIPAQAGLGGGSADAAAVLVGLNRLLGTNYSKEILCGIGVKLGADVPFCIVGGTKLCRGIGEVISYAPPLESCRIVIGKGNKGISTRAAFAEIDSERRFCDDGLSRKYDGSIGSVRAVGRNIFEDTSGCGSIGEIKVIKKILYDSGAEYSALSGSGSAVFGIFPDISAAERACSELKGQGFFSGIYTPVSYGACLSDELT